jgi:uncharacterized protein YdaT
MEDLSIPEELPGLVGVPRTMDDHRVCEANLRSLWAALRLIREAVEDCVPPGSVRSGEYLLPESKIEAEALVRGIYAIADQITVAPCSRTAKGDDGMAGKNQHVVPHNGKWAVKVEGSERASTVHDTQAEAVEQGRVRARREKVELLVHGRDGEIRSRDSYGHDPYPPKG